MTNYMNAVQLELPNIINYKLDDWKIEIWHDDCADSPREWDNLGEFCIYSNRNFQNESEFNPDDDDFSFKSLKNEYVMLPVSVYDHSGVSIYIGAPCDRWDSCCIGYYICSKDKIRSEYGVKRITKKLVEKVKRRMESEVETFNAWVNGYVYGFTLVHNGEEEDSMGGFFDDSGKYKGFVEDMYEYFPKEFKGAFSAEEAKSKCKCPWD